MLQFSFCVLGFFVCFFCLVCEREKQESDRQTDSEEKKKENECVNISINPLKCSL